MRKFKIRYFAPPFGNGPRSPSIALIEAESPELAEALMRDAYTRRGRGDGQYLRIVGKPEEYEKPASDGRVLSI